MTVIDCIVMKGRRIIVPAPLQQRALEQLPFKCMGIQKMRLLPKESMYCFSINADIENAIKSCRTSLGFQATQPKDKPITHIIPGKLWETVSADKGMMNNKHTCVL